MVELILFVTATEECELIRSSRAPDSVLSEARHILAKCYMVKGHFKGFGYLI